MEMEFLKTNYNMDSKITLKDFLLTYSGCIDIYSIDKETNEEYYATLEKGDIQELTKKEQNYKVIKINSDIITIYIN